MSAAHTATTAPIVVEPGLARQAESLHARADAARGIQLLGRSLRAWQNESRRSLGLPDDRPIVMTGHQAGIWHAGILTKWIVADEIAQRTGAAIAALLVDQDVNAASLVEYPALVNGTLRRAALPTTPAPRAGPTGTQPTVTLAPAIQPPAPEAAEALERIRLSVNAHTSAGSLARQMNAANTALLRDAGIARGATDLFATDLLATPLGVELLAAMRRDPDACASAYNAALASDPRVARPLGSRELPLWRLGGPGREPVFADDVSGRLAPRAFLMTALVRLAFADLFVHGTGGERYERVTEAWIGRWLGVQLAPMSVASATLRLPLEGHLPSARILTSADLRRFSFDPESVDGSLSVGKRALLDAVRGAPRGSAERRSRYRELMRHIDQARTARAETFDRLRADAESSREAGIAAELARSRTWPWALHGAESIDALRRTVAAR